MPELWGKNQEKEFFTKSLELSRPEQLFYLSSDHDYYAYWPKGYNGPKTTLQSRNALIGSYTEKWNAELFMEVAKKVGGYAVQGVICDEIGLPKQSNADVAICKNREVIQKPEDILMLLEVKMSIVWNWKLKQKGTNNFELVCIGDYKSHQGNPSLLRSDSMLKAIGKSINIRVSNYSASRIPIVVIGNTPITKHYYEKVDRLKKTGIIQAFWSLNPNLIDNDSENIKCTPEKGFYRFDKYEELLRSSLDLLNEEREFFSSMKTRKRLGELIEIANRESTYEAKAECFIKLIRETDE